MVSKKIKKKRNPSLIDTKHIISDLYRSAKRKDFFSNKTNKKEDFGENYVNYCIPNLLDIIKYSDFLEYLGQGSFGSVYKIFIKKNLFLTSDIIKEGIYALKIYNNRLLSDKCHELLPIFSKYGIIPKIYYHSRCFTIMNYIEGKTLYEVDIEHTKGDISELIYKNLLIKVGNLKTVVNNLFGSIKFNVNLDVFNWNNYMVSKDYKKVYLIDICT